MDRVDVSLLSRRSHRPTSALTETFPDVFGIPPTLPEPTSTSPLVVPQILGGVPNRVGSDPSETPFPPRTLKPICPHLRVHRPVTFVSEPPVPQPTPQPSRLGSTLVRDFSELKTVPQPPRQVRYVSVGRPVVREETDTDAGEVPFETRGEREGVSLFPN